MITTLGRGIGISRLVEAAIIPAGYHCALGGSVLHEGESHKDLDIFIYPHCGKKLKPKLLRRMLWLTGFVQLQTFTKSANFFDSKEIEIWEFQGVRIDFFFLR